MGLGEVDLLEIGLHPNKHVAVDYNHKQVMDGLGRVATPPKLQGMSGGAVWIWPRGATKANGLEYPKLTAITIEHRRGQRVLFGTNLELALAAIRRDHPELDPFIPVSKRISGKNFKT